MDHITTAVPILGKSQKAMLKFLNDRSTGSFTLEHLGQMVGGKEIGTGKMRGRAWSYKVVSKLFYRGLVCKIKTPGLTDRFRITSEGYLACRRLKLCQSK